MKLPSKLNSVFDGSQMHWIIRVRECRIRMMSRAQPLARPETWWYASARREPPRFDGKKFSPSVDIFSSTVKSFPILLCTMLLHKLGRHVFSYENVDIFLTFFLASFILLMWTKTWGASYVARIIDRIAYQYHYIRIWFLYTYPRRYDGI